VVKKALFALILVAFLGTARCYHADLGAAFGSAPIVGPMVQPPETAPDYLKAVGTPAPVTLPEADVATWFPAEPPADPYSPATWQGIQAFATVAQTPDGWIAACKKVAETAGTDRTANPKLGALACSADPTVTQFQRFAVQVLGAQASLALWIKGDAGSSLAAVQARQAELRVTCATSVVGRQGPATTPWAEACTKALDASYLSGDPPATFTALAAAYELAANEIAKLDPAIATEPAFAGAAATPTAAP